MRRPFAVLGALVVASSVVVTSATPVLARAARFRLISPAFNAGGTIPTGFTCDGQSVPPPLRWASVPARTVELALTVEDPDAPGRTIVHWVAWGIDPRGRGLPEGVVPAGVQEGRNSLGRAGYLGPCPPAGSAPHRYQLTLYALRRHLVLNAGASIDELRAAMRGLTLGQAELVGRYSR